MGSAFLIAAVVIGLGACPLMTWIQRRRGRAASCCTSQRSAARAAADNDSLAVLNAERAQLRERITRLEHDAARRQRVR